MNLAAVGPVDALTNVRLLLEPPLVLVERRFLVGWLPLLVGAGLSTDFRPGPFLLVVSFRAPLEFLLGPLRVSVGRGRFLLVLLLVSVLGRFVFREELTGLGIAGRLVPALGLVLLRLLGVVVVSPLLVATAAAFVLVRVVGAHTDPPAITFADTKNCQAQLLNSGDGCGVSELPTRVRPRYRESAGLVR